MVSRRCCRIVSRLDSVIYKHGFDVVLSVSDSRPLHPLGETLTAERLQQLGQLRALISGFGTVLVAYSGGVDSSLVAALAAEQLGDQAEAVTGVSPALAPQLLAEARWQAHWLGLHHRELATKELEDPAYANNPSDRCYACKRELHSLLVPLAAGAAQVLDGVNLDDLGDHRPGLRAAQELGVVSPLVACGINKQGVRELSRALGFPWWDKPAQPCLASRFPYGESITAARLGRVARVEQWLREQGYAELRVRSQGETARIELPVAALEGFFQAIDRQQLVTVFLDQGFTAVSLDLEGLVSGKLNRSLGDQAQGHLGAGA